MPLSERQRTFARELFRTGNQAEAALRAGYKGTKATLTGWASRLARKPDVRAEVERLHRQADDAAIFTRTEAVLYLSRIMRFDFSDVLDDDWKINLEKARKNGVADLLISTRTGFKIPSKMHAASILADLQGWWYNEFTARNSSDLDVKSMTDVQLKSFLQQSIDVMQTENEARHGDTLHAQAG